MAPRRGEEREERHNTLAPMTQEDHVSEKVIRDRMFVRPLRLRHGEMQLPEPNPMIEGILRRLGLWHVATIGNFEMNGAVIQALVERWRPETHTFHMPFGEVTITLEDVAVLLGLRVNGSLITGETKLNKKKLFLVCEELLGVTADPSNIEGAFEKGTIKFSWLYEKFQRIPENASDLVIERHARAYILLLLGKRLFPGKNTARVHGKWLLALENFQIVEGYSWGTAVLAAMYRALCRACHWKTKEINGPLVLLHTWFFTRFSSFVGRPSMPYALPIAGRWSGIKIPQWCKFNSLSGARAVIDSMTKDEFVWEPYGGEHIRAFIINEVGDIPDVWRCKCPLVCFEILEWHPSDRVMRQFGCEQYPPTPPVNLGEWHNLELTPRADEDFKTKFSLWIDMWDHNRWENIQQGIPIGQDNSSYELYFEWYRNTVGPWRKFFCEDRPQQHNRSNEADELPSAGSLHRFSGNTTRRGSHRSSRREHGASSTGRLSLDNPSLQLSYHPEDFFAAARMSVDSIRQHSHESGTRGVQAMSFEPPLPQVGPSLHLSDYTQDGLFGEVESPYRPIMDIPGPSQVNESFLFDLNVELPGMADWYNAGPSQQHTETMPQQTSEVQQTTNPYYPELNLARLVGVLESDDTVAQHHPDPTVLASWESCLATQQSEPVQRGAPTSYRVAERSPYETRRTAQRRLPASLLSPFVDDRQPRRNPNPAPAVEEEEEGDDEDGDEVHEHRQPSQSSGGSSFLKRAKKIVSKTTKALTQKTKAVLRRHSSDSE